MRSRARRRAALAVVGLFAGAALLVGFGGPANAHPLGNATVNHYDGLQLHADRVDDLAVEDVAEIPTLQRSTLVDTDGDGAVSPSEAAAYASSQCTALARADRLTVGGVRAPFAVVSASYAERPGAIRLQAGRLECRLSAPADLSRDATVALSSRWDSAGIGWHEITAVGDGVTLHGSPFPAASISDALRHYPNNLLSSPLDLSSGELTTSPGPGASTYLAVHALPGANVAVRALNQVSTVFDRLVGSRHLTAGVVALALALSFVLGAGHACLPGHGKTIMAAYLVGRRGRVRDVVAVGATVTVTHTLSVLVLGLLISLTAAFAPTQAEQDLAVVSGLLVAGVGVGLLGSAVRRRRSAPTRMVAVPAPAKELALVGAGNAEHDHAEHDHTEHDHPEHDHDHAQDHGRDHAHDHGHDHAQDHALAGHGAAEHSHGPFGRHSHEPDGMRRGGLVGLGVAGGLVPSPSALLVLLAAIALGRGAFGVLLVLVYGVGMAGTLTAAGLLLVRLRDRLARGAIADRLSRAARLVAALPFVTAGMVLVVGVALTLRALHGSL